MVAALVVCAATGCKDKGNAAKAGSGATDLDARCEALGKACGDTDKHVEKLVDECKEAAKNQTAKGCVDKAKALYDCYQKEVCGGDKVWTLEDFRVLAERHNKCAAERTASAECDKK
jgi:hypothetical protein